MKAAYATKRAAVCWNYVPAFIAVAETEHLRRAALEMRVSPSSLSRMIALLEHHLGYPVFDRSGRRLKLTPAGQKLFCAARKSMLMLNEAVGLDLPH